MFYNFGFFVGLWATIESAPQIWYYSYMVAGCPVIQVEASSAQRTVSLLVLGSIAHQDPYIAFPAGIN